jgi:hypothetical protein
VTLPEFDQPAADNPNATRVSVAWRALVLVYFLVAAVGHLLDPEKWSLVSGIILGTHELGHVVFAPFPEVWTVAGGTILQLLAPIIVAVILYRQKEPIGVAMAGCWLAISLANVAVYMADASKGELQLVSIGGGDDATHDWTYLFDHFNLIRSDQIIASRTRGIGWLVLGLSFFYGFWFCLKGLTSSPTPAGLRRDSSGE